MFYMHNGWTVPLVVPIVFFQIMPKALAKKIQYTEEEEDEILDILSNDEGSWVVGVW